MPTSPLLNLNLTANGDDSTADKAAYYVALPEFYGPMDLLLALIEKDDLEITKISLAQVTDQYLGWIRTLQTLTPDSLTEFLVIAAKLIQIKSEVLLPKPPPSIIALEQEDDTEDLVQQLKDYKRFKTLAQELAEQQETGQRSFVRVAALPKVEPKFDTSNLTVDRLLKAVRRALEVKPPPPDVDTVVSREYITIGQQIQHIKDRLVTDGQTKFSQVLPPSRDQIEVIVTLLAVLELIKLRLVEVNQPQPFGDFAIVPKGSAELASADWDSLSQLKDLT
jgi:segregation and condensation protein A